MKDRPPRSSVQDAQGGDGNQNKEVLVNISKTEEVMVSQGPEEAFTDDGKDVSPRECQKIISGLPENDGHNGANHDKEGPTDSCITSSQSSPCEQSETSPTEGQENMHGDNTDVYSG